MRPAATMERYARIDELLRQRAADFPHRVEPTWSRLVGELRELATALRDESVGLRLPHRLDRELLSRPVFVVGYPKSGTTLALALLDGHPQLAVIPGETRWFTDPEPTLAELHERWIHFLVNPVAFVGNGHVEAVRCAQMRLGEPDATGRRRPEPVPGSEFDIPVDTVVKAIGQRPRDEFHELLRSVDEDGRTADPKVFAAGDAVNGGASVVQAVREAKRAVAAIDGGLR